MSPTFLTCGGWRNTLRRIYWCELSEETLVIRTDNEDSFQGPVPQLKNFRSQAGLVNSAPARKRLVAIRSVHIALFNVSGR